MPAKGTNSVGWLDGWSHRKSHVINPASGAGKNYQVKIIVHFGYGMDNGADVYCNNHCRIDFGDVRFTDNDGVTFLDYWIEEKTDSYNATFWVEVTDDLSSNNVTIYLYYGNNDAITSSSGAKTFEFHIDKDNTTGWTKSDLDVTTSGDYLRFNNSIASNLGTAERQLEISSHYYVVEYRGKNIDVLGIADQICIFTYDFSWNHRPHQTTHPYFNDQQDFMYSEGDFEKVLWDEGFQFDTEYILAAYVDETNSTNGVDYFVYDSSGVEKASKYDVCFAVGSPAKIDNIFVGDATYSAGCDFRLRWLFVRKWTGNVEPSHGGWEGEQFTWLTGWGYRKSHIIQNASGAGTDYQVKIVVHYGYGTDNLVNVYCNDYCRPDFGDIRFTDDDGVTLLDYWIEKKTDWDKATFWVEVADNLSDSDALIYVYYGNAQSSTTSNGSNTFLIFDDFEDGDTAGWTVIDGSFAASTDYSYDGSYSGKLDPAVIDTNACAYQSLTPNDCCIVAWIYCHQRGDQWDRYGLIGRWTDQDDHYSAELFAQRIQIREITGGVGGYLADTAFPDNDKYGKWNKHEFRLDGIHLRYRLNDTEWLTATDADHTSGDIGLKNYKNEAEDIAYFDNVYVRKYTEPEPQHGSWGSEEFNWVAGWSYRKSHVINPASGAGTNYQVRIIVHYVFGIDVEADVYCGNKCKADFGDIRFTDDDGVTPLDYWIEEKTDYDKAIFWVEVAENLSSVSALIYMYYGNSAANTTSNGANTFVFFDDFSSGLNASKWYSEGNISVTGGECTIGGNNTYSRITTLGVHGTGHAARAKSKAMADLSWLIALGEGEGGDDWLVVRRWQVYAGTKFYHGVQDGDSGHRSSQASTDVDVNYHTSEIRWISGSLAYTEIDGTVVTFSTANVPGGDYQKNLCFKAFGDLESGTKTVVDWCLVRKCVDPEPSHGTWEGSPTDDEPPLINYIAYYPTQPTYLEDVIVVAEVSDESSISSVLLFVNNGSSWAPISMIHVGGITYNATIPAQLPYTQVSFLIEATDTVGNAINSSIYSYTVSDIPSDGINYTIDARSTLNVMLDVRSNQSIQVNIEATTIPGAPSPQFTVLYSPFSITANLSSGFTITIIYNYSDELLPLLGVYESTLTIYYWNETDNTWNELPTNVDMTNNVLTATVDHLTIFAVFGQGFDLGIGDGSYWPIMIAGIVLLALFVLSALGLRFSRSRVPWGEHIIEPAARPAEEETIPEETAPAPADAEEPRPLPTSELLCSYCGNQNPIGARYCIRCGRSLGEIYR